MALSASQIDCRGCGAKVDIHAGLRTQTFVCEYCGSVNEGGEVTAVQDMQSKREQYKPWSHLRLGMSAKLLGHEYQIIGRIRSQERYWWWDEWFLYSETGFPLWLQEGEGGFTIFRVFYPTFPINPWTAGSFVKLDNKGGNAQVRERGQGEIAFIEGELTWAAKPGEQFNYLECYRGQTRYSIEYTEQEIQFLRGEARDAQWIYQQFGIQEAVPPPLTFEGPEDEDEWDEDSDDFSAAGIAAPAKPMSAGAKALLLVVFLLGAGLIVLSAFANKLEKLHESYSFPARTATSKDEGVLLTNNKGKPISIELPKTQGAYELRLASSPLGKKGHRGGHCWWTQVDFLKKRSPDELKKIEAYLKKEGEPVDEWARYQVVHRVSAWFGRYWGIDEGERWNENKLVRRHYFRTKDRGPYYVRVYAHNCSDYASRKMNPVGRASMTLALYKNVWMTRWTFWSGIGLVALVIIVFIWRNRSMFSDD